MLTSIQQFAAHIMEVTSATLDGLDGALVAGLGFLPMTLEHGAGAEVLISAKLLTLFALAYSTRRSAGMADNSQSGPFALSPAV